MPLGWGSESLPTVAGVGGGGGGGEGGRRSMAAMASMAAGAVAVHAAWAAAQVPRTNKSMVTFFYNLLPSELAAVGVAVHAAAIATALAQRRTSNAGASVAAALHAVALALHVRSAYANHTERAAVIAALDRAGVPHRIQRTIPLSVWIALAIGFPVFYWAGPGVRVHRNVPYVPGVASVRGPPAPAPTPLRPLASTRI